jgi:hypothetical protein
MLIKSRAISHINWQYQILMMETPIVVAARSGASTVFARLNAVIVGSNPIQGMNVCVRLFCVRVVLCLGSGLASV